MEHIRIIAPGDPGFDWLYDLYMQSFPVHEQRLRERQEGVLGHPEYHCDLLCQGETRVGLLMWWAGPGFRYVEHFAIAPQLRGQSWGSRALREFLAEGDPVVLEIDPQGALSVMENASDYVSVFILPPSFEDLRVRLHTRNTDDPVEIERRLNNARGEVRKVDHYQYAIINDNLELAYTQLQSIVRAEKQRTSRFHPHILDD